MRAFAILSLLIVAAYADSAYFCEVETPLDASKMAKYVVANNAYDWDLTFNAISFTDFQGDTGDVEGRTAVRGNLMLGSGYSFGYEIRSDGVSALDTPRSYSLVVGGDIVRWGGGSIYPLGNNIPYAAPKEYGYVGGSFTGASYLQNDLVSGKGNLNTAFDAAKAYFTELSDALAAVDANAQFVNAQGGVAQITCDDVSSLSYSVNIPAVAFTTTSFNFINCNKKAQLVINFIGTEDVNFNGDFTNGFMNTKVIFNVPGTGRTINNYIRVEGSVLAPGNTFDSHDNGVVIGQVVVGNAKNIKQINRIACVRPSKVEPNPCVGFERPCTGLTGTLSTANGQTSSIGFTHYNLISFGRFVANTSDVQGRVAAAGDVTIGSGYSIGDTLITGHNTPDVSQTYSLVVGGDLTWISGALFPSGVAGPREDAFVVGSVSSNTAADLQSRVVKGQDTKALFAAAKTCYKGYSDLLAAQIDNVQSTIYWSGLFVTCNDASADTYVLSIDSAKLADFTYINVDNCNFQARWIVNIRGTGDVTFSGDSMPTIPGGTVYNVIGARTINVRDTALNGHLLAPDATLNQSGGVIVGKVVVADVVQSWQINSMSTCPVDTPITIKIVASGSANAGDSKVRVAGSSGLRVGDDTSLGKINSIDSTGVVTFSKPFTSPVASGTIIGSVKVSSLSGRPNKENESVSSASSNGAAIALLAAAALLF